MPDPFPAVGAMTHTVRKAKGLLVARAGLGPVWLVLLGDFLSCCLFARGAFLHQAWVDDHDTLAFSAGPCLGTTDSFEPSSVLKLM